MSITSTERRFRNILGFNAQLMISRPEINLRKHCCFFQLIKQIIYPGEWIFVLDCNPVQLPVVDAKSETPIFLLDKQDRGSPRRDTWSDKPFLLQLFNLLLQLTHLYWCHSIGLLGNWSCTRHNFNAKLYFSHWWQSR